MIIWINHGTSLVNYIQMIKYIYLQTCAGPNQPLFSCVRSKVKMYGEMSIIRTRFNSEYKKMA